MSFASKTFAALIAAAGLGPTAVQAGSPVGLVDGHSLVTIDTANPKVTGRVHIKGGFDKILGIDRRPADGMIYGITSDGTIVTIDLQSGQSTSKAKLSEAWKSGITTTIDFNPVADRLRVMGSNGANVRVNVDDGKVTLDGAHKFKEGDVNAGKTPRNRRGILHQRGQRRPVTTLYDIDAASGALVTQAPPNDGTLNTIGSLGIKRRRVAFEIATAESATTRGSSAMAILRVDWRGEGEAAGKIGGLTGKLTDITQWDYTSPSGLRISRTRLPLAGRMTSPSYGDRIWVTEAVQHESLQGRADIRDYRLLRAPLPRRRQAECRRLRLGGRRTPLAPGDRTESSPARRRSRAKYPRMTSAYWSGTASARYLFIRSSIGHGLAK